MPGLTITDQFGTMTVDAKKPVSLCAPAEKDGSMVLNPAGFLTCYKVKTVPPRPTVGATIFVLDDFGLQAIAVTRPTELCLPSVVIVP
jgi:hypothetical protein